MMNDAAIDATGLLSGLAAVEPPGGLAPGLRERAARGIVRRGQVLTWASSDGGAETVPLATSDLTGWECSDSSFHLGDVVPVELVINDGLPAIADEGQRVLLLHGLAFALVLSRSVYALDPPGPVRCIISVNSTNGTFRFHQIRPGEGWNVPDLDSYLSDKMLVLDIDPARL